MEMASRNHIHAEREEHLHVGAFCSAVGQKFRIAREEGFGK